MGFGSLCLTWRKRHKPKWEGFGRDHVFNVEIYRFYLFLIDYAVDTSAELCHHSNLTFIIKEQGISQILEQYGLGDNSLTSE
jgi:hypothetical protein